MSSSRESTAACAVQGTSLAPREVLLRAAEAIETRGWTQRAYGRDACGQVLALPASLRERATCLCTVGALAVAMPAARGITEVEDSEPHRILADSLGMAPDGITRWNDAPGRTQAEVVAALKAAASEASDRTNGSKASRMNQ